MTAHFMPYQLKEFISQVLWLRYIQHDFVRNSWLECVMHEGVQAKSSFRLC